jgi:tRNA-2-methylthio-N6-dimethylallyladenosine synthase
VLVEKTSKKSDEQMSGRTDTNKICVFDRKDFEPGDYVEVEITDCTSATLLAKPIKKSSIAEFFGVAVEA